MWILRFYLGKEVFKATFVVLLTLLAVLVLFLLIEELSDLTASYDASTALVYIALLVPGWTVKLFPLALMIGAVFALGRLADQSEITVIRSSGISSNQILNAVIMAGSILIGTMLLLAEFVVPKSEFDALNLYNDAHNTGIFQKTRYGVWLRHDDNFFHIKKMHSNSNMSQVKYYEYEKNQLQKITSAPNARIDQDGFWYLYQPEIFKFGADKVERTWQKIISIKTYMSPEIIQKTQIEPKIQSSQDLFEQRNYLLTNELDTHGVDYALWSRLSYPFVTFLMLFLAFPFVLGSNRIKTTSQRIFIGIMVSLSFFIISRVTEQMGALYQVPGWFTYFLPIVLFFTFALILYRRV